MTTERKTPSPGIQNLKSRRMAVNVARIKYGLAKKNLKEIKASELKNKDKAREKYMFAKMQLETARELQKLEEKEVKKETPFKQNLRMHIDKSLSEIKQKMDQHLAVAKIINIFVIQKKLTGAHPKGEFVFDAIELKKSQQKLGGKDTDSSEVEKRKKETPEEAIERLFQHIMEFAKLANEYHLKHRTSANDITRLAFPEFAGYLAETIGPLSMEAFLQLMKRINENVKKFSPNLHLLLSFAVKDATNNVYNVAPYVQCGPNPVNAFPTKASLNSNTEIPDPLYANTTNITCLSVNLGFWKNFEIEFVKFYNEYNKFLLSQPNELQTQTEKLLSFCQGHPQFIPEQDLISALEQFKISLKNKNLVPKHFQDVHNQMDLFREIMKKKIVGSDGKVVYCQTEGGALVPVIIDICVEHGDAKAYTSFWYSFTDAIKKMKDFFPFTLSQVLTSNSFDLLSESMMTSLGEHVDVRDDWRGIWRYDKSLVFQRVSDDKTEQKEEHPNTHFGGTSFVYYCPAVELASLKSPEHLELIKLHNFLLQKLFEYKIEFFKPGHKQSHQNSFIINVLKFVYTTLSHDSPISFAGSEFLQIETLIKNIIQDFELHKKLNINDVNKLIAILSTYKIDSPDSLFMQILYNFFVSLLERPDRSFSLESEMAELNPNLFPHPVETKETKTSEKVREAQEEKLENRNFVLHQKNLELLYQVIQHFFESKVDHREMLLILYKDFIAQLKAVESMAFRAEEIQYVLTTHDKYVQLIEKAPSNVRGGEVQDYLDLPISGIIDLHTRMTILKDNVDTLINLYQMAILKINEYLKKRPSPVWQIMLGEYKFSLAKAYFDKSSQAANNHLFNEQVDSYAKGIQILRTIPPDEKQIKPETISIHLEALSNQYVTEANNLIQLYASDNNIAHIELAALNFQKAYQFANEAKKYLPAKNLANELKLVEETYSSLLVQQAGCFYTLATHHINDENYSKGIFYCDQMMSIVNSLSEVEKEKDLQAISCYKLYSACVYYNYSLKLNEQNNPGAAKQYYDKAMFILKNIPDEFKLHHEKQRILAQIGLFNQNTGVQKDSEAAVSNHETQGITTGKIEKKAGV